jgi:hypothetical protein
VIPPVPEIDIRRMDGGEIDRIVEIHLASFPKTALSQLGPETVRRYYEWLLFGPHDVVPLGAYSGDELIGYTVGGLFRGATGGFVRKHRWYLMRRIVFRPWLLGDSLFRDRVTSGFRILLRPIFPLPASPPDRTPYEKQFGLLVTAVHPNHRGNSVFLLVKEAEQAARELRFEEVVFTIDPKNTRLAQMYDWLGYEKYPDREHWHGEYRKVLDPSEVPLPVVQKEERGVK